MTMCGQTVPGAWRSQRTEDSEVLFRALGELDSDIEEGGRPEEEGYRRVCKEQRPQRPS